MVMIEKIKVLYINIMDLFVGTSLVVNNTLNGENVLFVYLDGSKLITNTVLNVETL